MEKNNLVIIKCPNCGAEYTIDEIYLPKYLTGKSSTVVKDSLGKILYVEWEDEPDLTEKFTCEYCDTEFSVIAELTAKLDSEKEEIEDKKKVTLF